MRIYFLAFVLSYLSIPTFSQENQTRLVLFDTSTLEPVPYASVAFIPGNQGNYSDENGRLTLGEADSILVRHVGYMEVKMAMADLRDTLFLKPSAKVLSTVFVNAGKPQKRKYRKNSRFHHCHLATEYGITVKTSPAMTNVYIPYQLTDNPIRIRLNIYEMNENMPGMKVYSEVQLLPPARSGYISFTEIPQSLFFQDTWVVSIELLSPVSKEQKANQDFLKLFLHPENEGSPAFVANSFHVPKIWMPALIPENGSLIYFTE